MINTLTGRQYRHGSRAMTSEQVSNVFFIYVIDRFLLLSSVPLSFSRSWPPAQRTVNKGQMTLPLPTALSSIMLFTVILCLAVVFPKFPTSALNSSSMPPISLLGGISLPVLPLINSLRLRCIGVDKNLSWIALMRPEGRCKL